MVLAVSAVAFVGGFVLRGAVGPVPSVHAQQANRVFEIRTYTAAEGKFDALKARFRDHTVSLFEKHGMTNIGYWTPQEGPLAENTLIYILAYPSRDAATESWDAFRSDPEWKKALAESEAQGRLTVNVESLFADPADFSPIK
ncbi:MAG: NIPSNAP family protein [Luteitalea sp.]|nr:NIPSNAP family protein [Luteitalea sp.]